MTFLKPTLFLIILVMLSGCGTNGYNNDTNNTDRNSGNSQSAKYDIYFCSYIGIGSNDSRAGIYGLNRGMSEPIKIIDLSGKIIDSCAVAKNGNIYWGDRREKAIFKSNLRGGNVRKIVSGLDIPYRGLVIDEKRQRLYWSNWLQKNKPQSGEIGYSDLNGNNKKTISLDLKSGGYLAIDYTYDKLYVSDLFGDKIIKIDMNSNDIERIISTDRPNQLAIDSIHGQLFWYDKEAKKLMSKDLSENNADKIFDASQGIHNITEMAYDKKTNSLLLIIAKNFEQNLYRYNLNNKHKTFITNVPLEITGLVIVK